MPTDEWLNTHAMLACYVTDEIKAKFAEACRKAGISQSDALRRGVEAMLEGGKRKRK